MDLMHENHENPHKFYSETQIDKISILVQLLIFIWPQSCYWIFITVLQATSNAYISVAILYTVKKIKTFIKFIMWLPEFKKYDINCFGFMDLT